MNYLREINSFYDWLETNGLDASCIALWHALMAIANRAGWPDEFAVAVSSLEAKTGLSRKSVERARNRLEQCGLITWKSRKGNKAANYSMKPLYGNGDAQSVAHRGVHGGVQSVAHGVAITKQKLNETEKEEDARAQAILEIGHGYEQIYGLPVTSTLVGKIEEYLAIGMEPGAVMAAMRKGRANGQGMRYVYGILRDFAERGILTEAAAANEQEGTSRERFRGNSRTSDGQSGRKAPQQSITGGRIGWINRPGDV